MVEFIETAFNQDYSAIGVFLDIQGAFDNALPHKIIQGLQAHNAPRPPDIIRWYAGYLTSRQMTA